MSDTPRTNKIANVIYAKGILVREIRMLQHARQLERELADMRDQRDAALETIRRMKEATDE